VLPADLPGADLADADRRLAESYVTRVAYTCLFSNYMIDILNPASLGKFGNPAKFEILAPSAVAVQLGTRSKVGERA
jgi:hypothetical protein